ncbi:MAG: RNA polymerase sigma factor [Magnetococcales bacterium]|nr:RNA polymerase sigma factor [Magnetococcales bacterium]
MNKETAAQTALIKQWVEQAKAGNKTAFSELLNHHYDLIFRLCYRWTNHTQDAEDLAQEVCVMLAHGLEGFRGEAAFSSWVYQIVLNSARDFHRRKKRQDNREQSGVDLSNLADQTPDAHRTLFSKLILRCITRLPDALRSAVLLVHGEGLNHRQAGEIMACAEGTISWRLSEARKNLNHCLNQGG